MCSDPRSFFVRALTALLLLEQSAVEFDQGPGNPRALVYIGGGMFRVEDTLSLGGTKTP